MSSRDEDKVSAPEATLGQEGRERLEDPLISLGVAEGSSLIKGPLKIGEGEGGLPGTDSCEEEPWPKSEATKEGERLLSEPEGRAASPVDQEDVGVDFLPQLSIEATAIMRELSNLQTRRVSRYLSPQTCAAELAAELAALWGSVDDSSSRRGQALSSVEGKQVSASPLYPRGLGRNRAWVAPRRGVTSRMLSSESIQCPSSYPTSSDEASETQMMRVTICLKEGGQGKSSGLTELEDTGRHTTVHGRESFVHVPPSVLSSATRTLSSSMEKQASGELKGSLSKKKQSVVWGKEGSRHSIPGTAASSATAISAVVPAPAATASGAIPKTSPRKKAAQEKPQKQAHEKSLLDPSRGPLGRTFPAWGQRLKSAPVGPSTLPPISGVALLGKGSKGSLPSGPKECKPFCTGKKSLAKKTKESQLGAKEDDDSTRDSGLQAQLPTHRAEQPCMFMHRGEMSSGDPNRAPQVPGSSQVLRQRSARLRAPASAAEQDPTLDPLLPVRESQPELVQGTPGCPQVRYSQN
ncbi:uncharacterized protein CXorf49 homolog [Alexandromys fortis]|uniref:uncharacterized protein CXorf49 homolog n=1 Tax=Alexandromys fortis TaxID=100897 RepID=UPI002152DED0|nr:uncharacterized protein CXorf49 homolog [Microtus fortis]